MSKILIGVFSGIFIGAVIYELVNRANPDFIKKIEDLASNKVDEMLGVASGAVVNETHEAA
ncbi:MAG: hypothetical protein OEV89_07270 [Desulfobulbaceae bacterium]|nr:hypothetical protein [Desulfobulbaceae bacterium]HIJ90552.1 hypothetical protein [Deltaproteobacteria bacterium]